ncbi:MAG: cytochrome c maturation protein CcmE [Thermonemataceae bacterium]|nr:cytochrome c maturation protein CcmE [Thermonemataceae bacterium]
MKPAHIVAIIGIAVAIGFIVVAMGDSSEYVHFAEAQRINEKNIDKKVHVIGTLPKNTIGKVVGLEYEPRLNPNLFVFEMLDNQGKKEKVYYNDAKPQDFERSEQIVVIGAYDKNHRFVADKILMKCPSKYEGQQKQLN